MKKRLFAMIPYAVVLAVDFYLLPCLITDTGTAMLLMLCVMPLLAFFCSVIYGVRQGFTILLPITGMILFIPTIFIFFNETAWGYVIAYGLVILAGNGIGRIFYKKR